MEVKRSIKRANPNLVCAAIDPQKTYFNPLTPVANDADIDLGLEHMFKLESLGIKESEDKGSLDEIKINQFHDSLEIRKGQYHVALPWHEERIESVPSNYHVALAALHRVLKNLKSRDLLDRYDSVFKQQEKEGIIERFDLDSSNPSNYIWIPHRPIVKEAEQVTTKVRPIFNCSLKVNGLPSLNESSYAGIDLMTSLFKLLCCFRTNNFVLLADIKQAFLNIKLKLEKDKNRFCFLWIEKDKIIAYRYTTIVFGLAASPFILNYVVKHHINQYPNDICSQVLHENLYVDNLIYTHDDPNVLLKIYKTSHTRMKEGGFELRSWNSNHSTLKNQFYADGRGVDHKSTEECVLGYKYDIENDNLALNEFQLNFEQLTKRKFLSLTAGVFDPLGLYIPVSVKGKIIMRDIWMSQLDWDDVLSKDMTKNCVKHLSDLEQLQTIKFHRKVFSTCEQNTTLNVFCDASNLCYGFAVYINDGFQNSLLLAKSKVAPLKGRTLPSLELLSVFFAFKHLPQILSSFDVKFKAINIFVDAQIVLSWLLSGKVNTKQIFIRNRLQDIKQMADEIEKEKNIKCQYIYVTTEENPADMVTRGISFKEFQEKLDFWNYGPPWLLQEKWLWPQNKLGCLSDHSKSLTHSNFISTNAVIDKNDCVIDVSKYSSLDKVERIMTLAYKFINLAKKRDNDPSLLAKIYLVKSVQKEHFSDSLTFLQKNGKCPEKEIPDLVKNLNLFLDKDGIIRSKGRIAKVNFYDFEILNPILLPKDDHFTNLTIWKAHKSCKHLGVQSTLNKVRLQGYWIHKARQAIKKVLSECIICKKFNNFSFAYPKYTNFTSAQMDFIRPYKHVGVDFTGHIWVKNCDSNTNTKMYILIYTCLNVRAVHIDLLPDMSTKSFILSFQRFSNIYGICDTIYSDNAKYFSFGAKAFGEMLVSDEFKEHLRSSNIKHARIPIYASWVGSVWERMIRTIKSCIHKAVGRSILNYFDMLTLLSNIQNSINSRPLTYVSSGDDVLPLTPNSFFKSHDTSCINIRMDHDKNDPLWEREPPTHRQLVSSLKRIDDKFVCFKNLWYEQYLLSLRERSRDLFQNEWYNKIKVGDVVLIQHPSKSRPFWQMGVVTALIYGDDNKVRFVRLRKHDKQEDTYAIKLLYPLEIHCTVDDSNKNLNSNCEKNERLGRLAAQMAKEKITKQMQSI